jgi:hypothetical protein
MVRAALVALFLSALPQAALARIEVPAQVRYMTLSGESDWHETQVEFMTGKEMNAATRSYNYGAFSKYALIWFGEGQVAIIEISGAAFGCGQTFTVRCLPSIGNIRGQEQSGREWEICTGRLC